MGIPANQCVAFGLEGERLVAALMGGRLTRPNHPIDVVTELLAIEVKTVNADNATLRTHMSRQAQVRKNAWAKDHNLEALTVLVVVYPERYEVFTGCGFRNYDAEFMHHMGTFPK